MLPKGRRLQKQRMKWSGGTDLYQGKSRHTGVWEGHRHKGNSTLSQSRWDSVPLETKAGGWSEDRKTGNILEVKVLQTKRVWVSGIDITKYLSHKVAKINLERILERLTSPHPKICYLQSKSGKAEKAQWQPRNCYKNLVTDTGKAVGHWGGPTGGNYEQTCYTQGHKRQPLCWECYLSCGTFIYVAFV